MCLEKKYVEEKVNKKMTQTKHIGGEKRRRKPWKIINIQSELCSIKKTQTEQDF